MSKVGDVVFCVDCDLARSEHSKVAVGDSSGASEVPPRRMATKKDASGDALCTACLDARVQRRRAEFLQPHARSPYPEPRLTVSWVARSSVRLMPRKKSSQPQTAATDPKKRSKTAFVLSQSADLSASEVVAAGRAAGVEMSPGYVHSIRSSAKRKKGAKRKAGHPKGSKNGSGGAGVAAVGGLEKAEAQLLAWIIEHGTIAVQRMVDDLNERIRKLM
jgi:hypothetical protein